MGLLNPRDYVITDPSPQLPDTALVPDMSSIRVGYYDQGSAPTITLANQADDIVGHISGVVVTAKTLTFSELNQQVEFVSDQISGRWIMGPVSPRANRTYTFIPTAGQQATDGNAVTWTYDELVVGNLNDQFTLSADNGGTRLTAIREVVCGISQGYTIDAELSGNNSDTAWLLSASPSVVTGGFLPNVQNAFAHARGGSFRLSQQMAGLVHMAVGDWVRVDYTRVGTSDDSSIVNGVLMFSGVQELKPR